MIVKEAFSGERGKNFIGNYKRVLQAQESLANLDNLLFLFILSGAVGHVIWNILLKQSSNKIEFTRAFTLFGSIVLFPFFIFFEPLPKEAWPFFIATMIIHVFYKIFLCKVYDYAVYFLWISNCKRFAVLNYFTNTSFFKDDLSFLNQISVIVISTGILLLVFVEGKI